MKYSLTLLTLHCYLSEERGGDEIYLKCKGERIWPLATCYYHITSETTPVNITMAVRKGG